MKWARENSNYVLAWIFCAGTGVEAGLSSRWDTLSWIGATALWIFIAKLKDRTIAVMRDQLQIQKETIRLLSNSPDQRRKRAWLS